MSSRVLRLSLLLSGWLLLGVVAAQAGTYGSYKPGDFQTTNPNYPAPNPFYFEGRIDWNLLGINQPSNSWEYLQRGIHDPRLGVIFRPAVGEDDNGGTLERFEGVDRGGMRAVL